MWCSYSRASGIMRLPLPKMFWGSRYCLTARSNPSPGEEIVRSRNCFLIFPTVQRINISQHQHNKPISRRLSRPCRPQFMKVSRPAAVKIAASRQPAVKTNAAKPPRKSRLAAIFLSTSIRERQKYKVLPCKKIWCSVCLNIKLKLDRIRINWSIHVHYPERSATHCFVSPTVRF